MKHFFQNFNLRNLYNFFLLLSLLNIFFSTGYTHARNFSINDVELSAPFTINFDKNEIIDEGFTKAFDNLILAIVRTKDHKELQNIPLNEIKSMIETFSIKEEKFMKEIYHIKLNVSFNKKKVFGLFEKKNIFPALPIKKNIIFIPIIVDEKKNEIQMYSENIIYNFWKSNFRRYDLLNYILPTEDLEDLNLIKKNIKNLENFNFSKIVEKYNLKSYAIAIFFKNGDEIKLLNKIKLNDKKTLKQIKLNNIDLEKKNEVNLIIENLKNTYEDSWKTLNEINTSVKLPLTISIDNSNNIKISQFEKKLLNTELIYDFYIYKFNNKHNFYKIVFNGTPNKFLEEMKQDNYEFDTKNKIWILK